MSNECKVFYSWQSDLPNSTNRGFIQTALENAAKAIRNDDSIEVEPVIDRDTSNVPGSPDIAGTIFSKIDQASVFVCDVSIINNGTTTRPCPNPNVLIELGYALKVLGPEKVIMVLNSAFGGPELLPFDLRMRRAITYQMPLESSRAEERRKLEAYLTDALRTILLNVSPQPINIAPSLSIRKQAEEAIQTSQPRQKLLTRQFMKWLVGELDRMNPKQPGQLISDDALVEAIEQSVSLTCEFARLAEVVAASNNSDSAFELYSGFEDILNRYDRSRGFSGSSWQMDYDFYRFTGHQLFVILLTFLHKEKRWGLIAELLGKKLYVSNLSKYEPGFFPFPIISQYIQLLEIRKRRLQLNSISLHADLLNKLHTETQLAYLVSMQEFIDADSFLFYRTELQGEGPGTYPGRWAAWSSTYMEETPRYLIEAYQKDYASQLLNPLGLPDIDTFRKRLSERFANILNRDVAWLSEAFRNFDPKRIGTE